MDSAPPTTSPDRGSDPVSGSVEIKIDLGGDLGDITAGI